AADEDAARMQRQFDEESARLQADREQPQLQAQQQQLQQQQQLRETELQAASEQQALQDAQIRAQLFEQGLQRDEQQRQRDHEMAMAQLNNGAAPRPAPRGDGTPFFKVESAIKLMPKLLDDTQIDIYLVTFEKLAELHSWPKLHWFAMLQSQLRGKGLKVFSELTTAQCRDYDQLKAALLTAYELAPNLYRRKFRSLSKQATE